MVEPLVVIFEGPNGIMTTLGSDPTTGAGVQGATGAELQRLSPRGEGVPAAADAGAWE